MHTRTLFKKLRKLQDEMIENHPNLNYGGCCVYAALIGEQLEKLGFQVEVVTPTEYGLYDNAYDARKGVRNVKNVYEWVDNGVSFRHVAVRFKTRAGVVYTYDSERFCKGSSDFGLDGYNTDPEFGTGLTVAEAKAISSKQKGWNRAFNRREIPRIRSKVHEAFNM